MSKPPEAPETVFAQIIHGKIALFDFDPCTVYDNGEPVFEYHRANPSPDVVAAARRAVGKIRAMGYLDEGLLEHPEVDEANVLEKLAAVITTELGNGQREGVETLARLCCPRHASIVREVLEAGKSFTCLWCNGQRVDAERTSNEV